DPGRGERIGGNDVGAGTKVIEMKLAHCIGLRQDEDIVVAAQVGRPVGKARTTIAGLAKLEFLYFRAHGAVEHQDGLAGAAPQRGFEGGGGDRGHNWCARVGPPSWPRSSRPSTSLMPRKVEGADGRDRSGHDAMHVLPALTRPSPPAPVRRASD